MGEWCSGVPPADPHLHPLQINGLIHPLELLEGDQDGKRQRHPCGVNDFRGRIARRARAPRLHSRPPASQNFTGGEMKRNLLLGLALLLALAPGAFAQISTGNIYGTVTDETGAVMPGATVTLRSDLGTRTTTTGSQGGFRFLNLDRGRYNVAVTLTGFSTVSRDVTVTTGENVTLDLGLRVAQLAETVTVTGETPLVDLKKRGTATTMTTEELSLVPSARDPWSVLKNVPGVLLDRVNVAGNENGQQASAAGKGSTSGDKTWNLDGLVITDMSATGASPTYFDFGAFQEITVTTGGTDLAMQTGGIGINLVTRRGTNKFHGGARYLIADDKYSSGNVRDEHANDPRLQGSDKADHIKRITEYGFDLGGPIVKDKLWFYGTFGKQDIKLIRLVQTPDDTLLPSYNFKLNWQATGDTMVSGFYFVGKKEKFGRAPSFGVQGEDSFNWNQGDAPTEGFPPLGLYKLQADHTFSPNFFVSAKAAYYDTGFFLTPRGGQEQSFTLDYVNGVGLGSVYHYEAIRPQKTLNLDGSYFFEGMGGNNELKWGFGYRSVTTSSLTHYGGNQLVGVINVEGNDSSENHAWVARDGPVEYGGKYTSGYLGDVFSKNRLTLNLGVRYDRQAARNLPSEAPANASFPAVVPALTFDGSEDIIEWSDISPRAGLSFALDEARKTVVRASYARYASQLSYGQVTDENPSQFGYLAFGWNDRNGDKVVQPNEVDFSDFHYNVNIDPDDPGAVGDTIHKIDRDYHAKHDHEVVVGLDREVAGNFAVGAAVTWRRADGWDQRLRLGGNCAGEPTRSTCPTLGPGDYAIGTPTTANGFTAVTFLPNSALVTAGGGGRLRTNRDGYFTDFKGLEFTATKRLSNKWMARLAFSFNDWQEHWEDGVVPTTFGGSPGRVETDPLVDGGQVALLSGGSGKASFYSSVKWQGYANAMVQLPWSIDLAGSVFAKQGGSYPIGLRLSGGRDGTLTALATEDVDTFRYENVVNVDLRLAKTIKFRSDMGLTLAVEGFNVLNNDVVLSRSRFANQATFVSTIAGAQPGLGRIEEIIAPRIARFSASFQF
jgi:hypothetical protein